MTSLILNKTSIDLVEYTTFSAGYQLGVYDLREAHGALLSVRIKNFSSPSPTFACNAYICISYTDDEVDDPPIEFGEIVFGDADNCWFSFTTLYGTVSANDERNFPPIEIPAAVQHVAVVFNDVLNGVVGVEAKLSAVYVVEDE